jgi:hypothetical protein
MLRESLEPGSRHASVAFRKIQNGLRPVFLVREEPDREARVTLSPSTALLMPPDAWLQIERQGEEVVGSYSKDGSSWTEIARATFSHVPGSLLVGFAGSARDDGDAPFSPLRASLCEIKLSGLNEEPKFRRGDADGSGNLAITDSIRTLSYLLLGGEAPACIDAADTNDSGALDLSDPVLLLNHLFLGAPAPPAPFAACGVDPTEDGLRCEAIGPCA